MNMGSKQTKMKKFTILALTLVFVVALAGTASACAASYVKSQADRNKGTALYDKAAQVADKYMQTKGVDPTSSEGQIARPYVIGTSITDHQFGGYGILQSSTNSWGNWSQHSLNKSVDECVKDSLSCPHHNGHFGDGQAEAKKFNPTGSKAYGG